MRPFVITGPPRAGTSILSTLICRHSENAYCMNETLYKILTLRRDLQQVSDNILDTGQAPNKVFGKGDLVYNVHDKERIAWVDVGKKMDTDMWLGSKVTSIYLNALSVIRDQDIAILAIVRNPIYIIASWLSEKVQGMPMAHLTDDDMNPRWEGMPFETEGRVTRMAELLNYFLSCIVYAKVDVILYEDLSRKPKQRHKTLKEPWASMIVDFPLLENLNDPDRYESNIDEIHEAVREYTPLAREFGYD